MSLTGYDESWVAVDMDVSDNNNTDAKDCPTMIVADHQKMELQDAGESSFVIEL